MTEPCTWPVSYAGCSSCSALDNLTVQEKADVEAMATTYLWNWTQRQYGVCAVALRPCRSDCSGGSTFWGAGPFPWAWGARAVGGVGGGIGGPALIDGQWYGLTCGRCGSNSCDCGTSFSLALPPPVSSITQVLVDGVALAAGAYRLDPGGLLVRLDGEQWPACQDMTLATTEAGTWQVTYERGREVPVGGQLAAGVLACELAKALCRDVSCALPQRIQTITRQGVSMAVLDNFQDVKEGRTGIWLIDSWVSSVTRPPMPGMVFSVDLPQGGRGRLGNV